MTTIGPNTRINGRIDGDADVVVEGRVDGTISLTETLTVAEGGFVTGDVHAEMVIIEGFASGTLRANSVVHLTSTAQVEGEIFANAVRLDPGARLRGRIEMDVEAAPPLATRPARKPVARPRTESARPTPPPVVEAAPVAEPEPEPVREVAPAPEPERTPAAKPKPAPAARPRVATPTAAPAPKARAAAPVAKKAKTQTLEIDPDELTVKELREMLTERGLPLSGTKSELVDRLRNGE